MATKKEKSFFGKIMGNEDEEEKSPYVPQLEEDGDETEVLDEDLESDMVMNTVNDDEDEDEDETEEENNEEEEQEDAPITQKEPKSAGEEWMADFEGQLNIDMYQTKDNVIIKSTIAGVRPDDIDITVANDMITIKGTRKREETITQDDYFYQECYWGSFSRSVIIPVDIDSEQIEADLKDGLLTVIVPKAAKAKTKKVKVKGL